jgi:transcriptional regulator with AAA-type ATPase domain/tetratricopeptide (TPR) repeat protein
VDVNCAAIPDSRLEAELFGSEPSAFTDARTSRPGLFQAAHGGTIFLDEIGLLTEGLQAKLRTAIEERSVRRIGGSANEPVDVWVISATNIDVAAAIDAGRFRYDFYRRLAVLLLRLPPLRERRPDISLLADHFLQQVCAEYGLPEISLAPAARDRLLAYAWPDNVRQLYNVIERAAVSSDQSIITGEMLDLPDTAPDPVATKLATQTEFSAGAQAGPVSTLPPAREAPHPIPSSVTRWQTRLLTFLRLRLLTPEDSEVLSEASRALEMVKDKVGVFGGRIDEISPRSIGAVFGLEPVEDAPQHAAHAAMSIQRAFARENRDKEQGVAVKISIHVAQVLVGRSSAGEEVDADAKRAQWMVLDNLIDPIDTASIVASSAAAAFLQRRFAFRSELASQVGGIKRYVLDSHVRSVRDRRRTAAFVGRQQELNLLRSRLTSVVSGQGQIVSIVGEAGLGKSRLLREFRQELPQGRITYLEAHCLPFGASIPYLPAIEILRRAARIVDVDTPEAGARKLRRTLERIGIDPAQGLPYLLQFLGLKGDIDELAMISPEAVQARTFDILRRMCATASRKRPLVIVIEDMHWVDKASETLGNAIHQLQGMPMLLILTYRPSYQPSWTMLSAMTQIVLQPLSRQDSISILTGLLPSTEHSPAAAAILAKSEGNPLFLEELARATAEQPDGAPPGVSTPDTVQGLFLERINRLSDRARQAIELASVLGREVSARVLSLVWEAPDELERPLREVMDRGLMYEQLSGDELAYTFTHPLIQDVTYTAVPPRRRQRLHAAAGRALEQVYEGRVAEAVHLMAHHFGLSDEADKAVDYALLAADADHRRWANTEALAHFDVALKRLYQMPDTQPNRIRRIDAVIKQAEVKFALGRHAEHIHALEEIQDLVRAHADTRQRAAWHYWIGFLHSLIGSRPEVAIDYCREASSLAEAGGLEEIRAFAECCLAQAYEVAGRFTEALVAGKRALAIFEAQGNVWWACRTLWILSIAPLYMGDWRGSLAYCHQALAHAEAVNDPRLRIVGLLRIGFAHLHRGDVATGFRYYEDVVRASPGPYDAAMAKTLRGYGLVKTGNLAAAQEILEQAMAWFEAAQLKYTQSLITLRLAECHVGQGNGPRAREMLEGVIRLSRECGYRHCEAVASRIMGESFLAEDPVAAAAHLEAATALLQDIGARYDLARVMTAQGELADAAGDRVRARGLWQKALAIFEELDTIDEPSRVRRLLERA